MPWVAALALAVAAAVNCAAVHLQRRHGAYDRLGRRAWPAHIALLCAVWGAAIACIALSGGEARWPLPDWVRPLGLLLGLLGTALFGAAFRELGLQSLFNGNFFGRGDGIAGGVYRVLADPMYDAYALLLLSLALRRADAAYLLLALESVVLLNLVEARVERVVPAPALSARLRALRSGPSPSARTAPAAGPSRSCP